MAFVHTVTEVSAKEQMEGLRNLIVNLTCEDDEVEVINKNFSKRFRTGQDPEIRIKELLIEMQNEINNYFDEKTIMASQKLNDAIDYLQNNLTGE